MAVFFFSKSFFPRKNPKKDISIQPDIVHTRGILTCSIRTGGSQSTVLYASPELKSVLNASPELKSVLNASPELKLKLLDMSGCCDQSSNGQSCNGQSQCVPFWLVGGGECP